MSRVLLGISGGVDSAVSAWMLQRDGHDVVAVTLLFCDMPAVQAKCRKAEEVCKTLGIEHHVIDVRDEYRREVVERFVQAYEYGFTPDPFALQNARVVLPALRRLAAEYACDKVATGHYASITADPDAPGILPLQLAMPQDTYHEQTYYLHTLAQEDLAKTLFPLWDTAKPVVHMLAMRAGLMVAEFVDEPKAGFLEGKTAAEWLESSGRVEGGAGDVVHVTTQAQLGTHDGLYRHDLGSAVTCAGGEELYVVAKDMLNNRLLVGPQALVGAEQCMVADVNWVSIEPVERKRSCKARFRAGKKPVPVQLMPTKQGLLVTFNERVQGLMPGEPIVFYSDKLVLGGGYVVG